MFSSSRNPSSVHMSCRRFEIDLSSHDTRAERRGAPESTAPQAPSPSVCSDVPLSGVSLAGMPLVMKFCACFEVSCSPKLHARRGSTHHRQQQPPHQYWAGRRGGGNRRIRATGAQGTDGGDGLFAKLATPARLRPEELPLPATCLLPAKERRRMAAVFCRVGVAGP